MCKYQRQLEKLFIINWWFYAPQALLPFLHSMHLFWEGYTTTDVFGHFLTKTK